MKAPVPRKAFHSWALRRQADGVLVGRYYFGTSPAPEHEGCVTALFKTRAEARKAAKGAYYKLIPERVAVTIYRV